MGLISNIASTLSGIRGRTKSTTLKQKLEILQEPQQNLLLEQDVTPHPASNALRSAAIESRLWFLLQREMVNPRAWPSRNPDILNLAKARCVQDVTSQMLDDSTIDEDVELIDWFPESQETLIDDDFNMEDDLLDTEGDTEAPEWDEDLFANENFLVDDTFADQEMSGNMSWVALDTNPKESAAQMELVNLRSEGINEVRSTPKTIIDRTNPCSAEDPSHDDLDMGKSDIHYRRDQRDSLAHDEHWAAKD